MLLIWAKQSKFKIEQDLGQAMGGAEGLDIQYHQSMESIPNPTGLGALLALGPEPLEVLAAHKVVPKNRTVTSLRTQPIVLPNTQAKALVSYSPGILVVDYRKYVDLLCDVGSAIRLAKTGSIEPEYGEYEYVTDFHDFRMEVEYMHDWLGHPIDVGMDTETIGLDPYRKPSADHPGARIVSIQYSHTKGRASVVYFPSREFENSFLNICEQTRDDLEWLLTSPKVKTKGANLKYDLHWLWVRAGLRCTNFVFDTTLVGSLLDENRSNGLDVHVKIYAPALGGYSDVFDRTVDKARMDLVPKATLLPYAGGDSDAVLRVADVQKQELLKDEALTRFYLNIQHPAARAFELIEQGGMLVDIPKYKLLRQDLVTEVNQLIAKARSILGGRIWAKHRDDTKPGGINLTKASMLSDFMFSPMGLNMKPRMWTAGSYDEKHNLLPERTPSTGVEHLMMFKDVPEAQEFVGLLSDYSSAVKTLGTYVDGFMEHIRADGRFHPSYYFFAGNKDNDEGGTNTGRLSAKDPAFQTIPKHTKWSARLRECYPAPPGYLILERDYSQGELKVVACVANEQNMIAAYLAGKDLHALTGGETMGLSYEQMMALKISDPLKFEDIRQRGKPGNFGLLYGMMAEGFIAYARGYGVHLTLEQAEEFRYQFLHVLYPGLTEYHKKYKAMAHKYGYVRSPLGRIRHLPLINSTNRAVMSGAERQAINSPIQGTLSDMLIWSIALEHQCGLSLTMPCFGDTHDAAYSYCPEDKVDECVTQGLDIMENLPFHKVGWHPQLQFTADAKIGPDMSALKKWSRPK